MARDTGFFQLRRGIWAHVREGRLSLQDVAVHQYIASQADTRTGVWNGSAGALSGELCISPRVARRLIERLTRGDYIRRFPIPGRHVCYPILVHKFLITDGEHRGEQLNALASTSPADLRYFPGEHMSEHRGEHRGEQLSSQKRLKTVEVRLETKEPAPASPSPDRFEEFWTVYPKRVARLAAQKAWVKLGCANGHFAEIILAVEKWKSSEQWADPQFIPNASTFLNGKRWQDEIPARAEGNRGREGNRRPSGAVPPEPGKKYPEPTRLPTG